MSPSDWLQELCEYVGRGVSPTKAFVNNVVLIVLIVHPLVQEGPDPFLDFICPYMTNENPDQVTTSRPI
jgi:hypothetical protein